MYAAGFKVCVSNAPYFGYFSFVEHAIYQNQK